MICIKCSSETKVINSRPHKKTPSVWRRRQCVACGTVFTTMESVSDEAYHLRVVKDPESTTTFSLPHLMMSIFGSLAHRPEQLRADEAYWLAQTVAQNIQASAVDTITARSLAEATLEVVSLFDATAGIQYGARHGLVRNVAQRTRRGRPRTTRRP